ncbi:hypothetical protein GCM10011506_43230 [Marivirga lumbricoides]|uniref:DUF58 domain-containing protein n=1 Tax=Marivirga lumbricoides TaxID=1046115 RepID=A0ABQ1N3M4_9BACT|nr:hypothetical protein GCM10011506_43230 [Marivirga lumbricoides]
MRTLQEIFSLTNLEALKALQIYVHHLVDGLITGMHQSPKKGFGIEFKEYKNYAPGDSLKQLDWKYFAKTDHYMIKEAEVERQHDFLFAFDLSRSMEYSQDGISKFNLAKACIASFTYLTNKQHDNFKIINSSNHSTNYEDFLFGLIKQKIEEDFKTSKLYPTALQSAKSTAIILSDGYMEDYEIEKLISNWAISAQKCIFIHFLYQTELKLEFDRENYRFQDLETGQIMQVNTKEAKSEYADKVEKWHEQIKHNCLKNGVLYFQMDGRKPLQNELMKLLNQMNFNFG